MNSKTKSTGFLLVVALCLCSVIPGAVQAMEMTGCKATTAFSPNGGGTALVVSTIASARKTIRMSTYSFTEPVIGKALLDAKKRGVDVSIVVDKDHNGRRETGIPSVSKFLVDNGVNVVLTRAYQIQHNKVIIVDAETVQTGSFNYSRSAEKYNAENVLVISGCPKLADQYMNDWKKLYDTAINGGNVL